MTDTWQGGPIPPPPSAPPPGHTPGAPSVNPFLAKAPTARATPSRTTLMALAGVAAVTAAGAWLAFGHSGGKPAPLAAPPVVSTATAEAPTGPPVVDKIPTAPTSGLDLGAAPRLADVVPEIEQFVEEARGHRFKQHVPVTPLSDKAFVKALRATDGGSGKTSTDPYVSVKALHLVPAGLNASGPVPDSAYASIAGFYDDRTKKLYVRGTTLNPLTQSVVAHELTHALDDQWFGLAKVQKLGRNSDQSEAILSLIEGDARSVENRFSKALTPQRQHQEDSERAAYFRHMAAPASDVIDPFVLDLFTMFPYELGSIFIDAIGTAGPAAVDAAFAAPPASTLDILDPEGRYLRHLTPAKVAAPKAAGTLVDHDTLGPLGLASVLSEGNPIDWSREGVVEGWRGDAYVTVRSGASTCVHDSIRTANASANTALAKALRAWAARHPGASVVTTAKTGLVLVSCQG